MGLRKPLVPVGQSVAQRLESSPQQNAGDEHEETGATSTKFLSEGEACRRVRPKRTHSYVDPSVESVPSTRARSFPRYSLISVMHAEGTAIGTSGERVAVLAIDGRIGM